MKNTRHPARSTISLIALSVGVFAVAMLGMNYYYASKCVSTAPQAGSYADALERRLLAAEARVLRNTILVDRLVNELEKRLGAQEKSIISELMLQAEDQAVALAIELAKFPAPPMPDIGWNTALEDPAKLSQIIDDAFQGAQFDDYMYGEQDNLQIAEQMDKQAGASRKSQCDEWKVAYAVIPGMSWGALPPDLQIEWKQKQCDYLTTRR